MQETCHVFENATQTSVARWTLFRSPRPRRGGKDTMHQDASLKHSGSSSKTVWRFCHKATFVKPAARCWHTCSGAGQEEFVFVGLAQDFQRNHLHWKLSVTVWCAHYTFVVLHIVCITHITDTVGGIPTQTSSYCSEQFNRLIFS